MSKPLGQSKEFFVRIPKTENRRLSILKFNESLNVKPQQWTTETLRMEREDNRRHGVNMVGEIAQEFGEGSEYGKAAREESRRKKYGRQGRKYEHDKQPWKLSIEQTTPTKEGDETEEKMDDKTTTASKKVRKFRSMREAGAGEHADYWVFYKSGNDLEAYKVDEWYQFLPAVTYKYLDAEQAEEHFKEMDKIVNQLAFKAQIQKQLAEQEDKQKETLRKGGPSSLKIKDEASSDEEDGAGEGGENGTVEGGKESGKGPKKKGGAAGNKKKLEQAKREKKKQRVKNADEVAAYESDDGDDEGREYDYMSDSGTDTDREELNVEKKMDEDLVGVMDERGLKGALESDEEDDDEEDNAEEKADQDEAKGDESGKEENEDEEMADPQQQNAGKKNDVRSSKAVKTVEKIMAQKPGAIRNAIEYDDDKDSSGAESDDEDPDSERVTSVLFIQDKRKKQTNQSAAASGNSGGQNQQRKRPADEESGDSLAEASKFAGTSESDPKRQKFSSESDDKASDVINEAFIRKLLERKPHSTKQLLTKVNQRIQQQLQKQGGEVGSEEPPKQKDKKVVNQLAVILKKIEPYQFRKKNEPGGKEVLYFSMNRTA